MKNVISGRSAYDGAGVKLFRVFSNNTATLTDPFLLLDHFGSDNPEDYLKGFPWHPHRGIETVTYMLKGDVEHGDNIGNKGVIGPGDIQWMSAGSGIIHQEMPQGKSGMEGFQLWVNMPAKKKMSDPKYRGIVKNQIPVIKKDGIEIRLISGTYENNKGPVVDLIVDVSYMDITLEGGRIFTHKINKNYTTFCYVVEGSCTVLGDDLKKGQLMLLKNVSDLSVKAKDKVRFLFVSGKPLNEPIAWGGPIVMNTQEELIRAFSELEDGTFIKYRK